MFKKWKLTDSRNCSRGCNAQKKLETTLPSNLFFFFLFSLLLDWLIIVWTQGFIYFPLTIDHPFLFSFKHSRRVISGPFLPGIVLSKHRQFFKRLSIHQSHPLLSWVKSTNLPFSLIKMPSLSSRHPSVILLGSFQSKGWPEVIKLIIK